MQNMHGASQSRICKEDYALSVLVYNAHNDNSLSRGRPVYCGRYSDSIQASWSGVRKPVVARFFGLIETEPETHASPVK